MRLFIGRRYRPIEGDVIGELLHHDVISQEIQWLHKDRVFIIPYERFNEYFCEVLSHAENG